MKPLQYIGLLFCFGVSYFFFAGIAMRCVKIDVGDYFFVFGGFSIAFLITGAALCKVLHNRPLILGLTLGTTAFALSYTLLKLFVI